MGIEIPPELQWVAYLTGQQWPKGDETAMFALAGDWNSAAEQLSDAAPGLQQAQSQVSSSLTGQTADAAAGVFAWLLSGDSSVPSVAGSMTSVGNLAEQTGTQIQYTKLQILSSLAIAAYEIATALWEADFTFGASLAWIPAIEAITVAAVRELVEQLWDRIAALLSQVATAAGRKALFKAVLVQAAHLLPGIAESVAEGVAQGAVQDLLIQDFQILEGVRNGLDFDQTVDIAASALVGGVVGPGVHHGLAHVVGQSSSIVGKALSGAGSHFGVGVVANVAGTVATGGSVDAADIFGGAAGGVPSGGIRSFEHGGAHGAGDVEVHPVAVPDTKPAAADTGAGVGGASRGPLFPDQTPPPDKQDQSATLDPSVEGLGADTAGAQAISIDANGAGSVVQGSATSTAKGPALAATGSLSDSGSPARGKVSAEAGTSVASAGQDARGSGQSSPGVSSGVADAGGTGGVSKSASSTVAGGGESASTPTHGAGQSSGSVADAATPVAVSKSGAGVSAAGSVGHSSASASLTSSGHGSATGSAPSQASRFANQPAATPTAKSGAVQSFTHNASQAEANPTGNHQSQAAAALGSAGADSSTTTSSVAAGPVGPAADTPPPPAQADRGTGAPDTGAAIVSTPGPDQGDAASTPPAQLSLEHSASPAGSDELATANGEQAAGLPRSVESDSSTPAMMSSDHLDGDTSLAAASGAAASASTSPGGVDGSLVSDGAQQREEHLDTAMAVPDSQLPAPRGSDSVSPETPGAVGGPRFAVGEGDSETLSIRGPVASSDSAAPGGETRVSVSAPEAAGGGSRMTPTDKPSGSSSATAGAGRSSRSEPTVVVRSVDGPVAGPVKPTSEGSEVSHAGRGSTTKHIGNDTEPVGTGDGPTRSAAGAAAGTDHAEPSTTTMPPPSVAALDHDAHMFSDNDIHHSTDDSSLAGEHSQSSRHPAEQSDTAEPRSDRPTPPPRPSETSTTEGATTGSSGNRPGRGEESEADSTTKPPVPEGDASEKGRSQTRPPTEAAADPPRLAPIGQPSRESAGSSDDRPESGANAEPVVHNGENALQAKPKESAVPGPDDSTRPASVNEGDHDEPSPHFSMGDDAPGADNGPALRLRGGAPDNQLKQTLNDYARRILGAKSHADSDHLLDDLRAKAQQVHSQRTAKARPHPHDGLGPDPFGLRDPSPTPPHLEGVKLAKVPIGSLGGHLHALDMARREGDPPPKLDAWSEPAPEGRGWFAEDSGGRPEDPLPARLETPKVFHSIWLGSPVTDGRKTTELVRRNLEKLSKVAQREGMRVLLWTDVSREEFDRPGTEAGRMRSWAQRNKISLLSPDEVFHVDEPMHLGPEYRLENAKGTAAGYTAASDILRLEVLHRFGGIYTDHDNQVRRVDGMRDLAAAPGFALHSHEGRIPNNSALLAAREHPFIKRYLDKIKTNYELRQDQLHPNVHGSVANNVEAHHDKYVSRPASAIRRRSVIERTGPFNFKDITESLNLNPADVPRIRTDHLQMGSAHTWLSTKPLRFTKEQTQKVLEKAVSGLIWDLHNRQGDLNLAAVEPLIEGLPDPKAGWKAVVDYMRSVPELREQVKTVTYAYLRPKSNLPLIGDRPRIRQLDLPSSVLQSFGLPGQARVTDLPGTWRRAAFAANVPSRDWGPVAGPARPDDADSMVFGRPSESESPWDITEIREDAPPGGGFQQALPLRAVLQGLPDPADWTAVGPRGDTRDGDVHAGLDGSSAASDDRADSVGAQPDYVHDPDDPDAVVAAPARTEADEPTEPVPGPQSGKPVGGEPPLGDGFPHSESTIEDIQGWIGDVNNDGDPRVPPTGDRLLNCAPATMVVFDRLSGTPSFGRAHLAQLATDDLSGFTGLSWISDTPEGIHQQLTSAGGGAHTVVGIKYAKGQAHSFNVFFDGEKVHALDGQHRTVSAWPPKLDRKDNPVVEWFVGAASSTRVATDAPTAEHTHATGSGPRPLPGQETSSAPTVLHGGSGEVGPSRHSGGASLDEGSDRDDHHQSSAPRAGHRPLQRSRPRPASGQSDSSISSFGGEPVSILGPDHVNELERDRFAPSPSDAGSETAHGDNAVSRLGHDLSEDATLEPGTAGSPGDDDGRSSQSTPPEGGDSKLPPEPASPQGTPAHAAPDVGAVAPPPPLDGHKGLLNQTVVEYNRSVRQWLDQIGGHDWPDVSRGAATPLGDIAPADHWWRLYIDPQHHAAAVERDDPGSLYDEDQSPGFQANMERAFEMFLNDPERLTQRVDSNEYFEMHWQVTRGIPDGDFEIADVDEYPVFHSILGDGPADDLLTEQVDGRPLVTIAPADLGKYKPLPSSFGDEVIVTISSSWDQDVPQIRTEFSEGKVSGMIDAVFGQYYDDIAAADTEHDQLRAIGRVVRTLHVMHPHNDGNGRLNINLLLPRLLLANGFSPVITHSMADLFSGGFSLDQIATALRWSQGRDLTRGLDDLRPPPQSQSRPAGAPPSESAARPSDAAAVPGQPEGADAEPPPAEADGGDAAEPTPVAAPSDDAALQPPDVEPGSRMNVDGEGDTARGPLPVVPDGGREAWDAVLADQSDGAAGPSEAKGKQRESAPESRSAAWDRYVEAHNARGEALSDAHDQGVGPATRLGLDAARRDLATWGDNDPEALLADYRARFDAPPPGEAAHDVPDAPPPGEAAHDVPGDAAADVSGAVVHDASGEAVVGPVVQRDVAPVVGGDLDHEYGPLVGAKRVKPEETDAAGLPRVNPVFYRLSDLPPLALLSHTDARWHYTVDAEGEIRIGSEELGTLLSDEELTEHYVAYHGELPESAEQLEGFRGLINGQGHPTIAVEFDDTGAVVNANPVSRVSGEIGWNAEAGQWEVNDKSGRYMSEKVRIPLPDPQDMQRWVDNVAGRLSAHLGEPVQGRLLKHGDGQANPAPPAHAGPPAPPPARPEGPDAPPPGEAAHDVPDAPPPGEAAHDVPDAPPPGETAHDVPGDAAADVSGDVVHDASGEAMVDSVVQGDVAPVGARAEPEPAAPDDGEAIAPGPSADRPTRLHDLPTQGADGPNDRPAQMDSRRAFDDGQGGFGASATATSEGNSSPAEPEGIGSQDHSVDSDGSTETDYGENFESQFRYDPGDKLSFIETSYQNEGVRTWLGSIAVHDWSDVALDRPVRLSEVVADEDRWRIYLDSADHASALEQHPDNPGSFYDNDESPGFQQDLETAYRLILDDPEVLQGRLDWSEYLRMHTLVTGHARDAAGPDEDYRITGTDRGRGADHHVGTYRVAADLLDERISGHPLVTEGALRDVPLLRRMDVIVTLTRDDDGDLQLTTAFGADRVPAMVDAVFDRYQQDLAAAGSEHEQLRAIARVVRTLHVMHPFAEGNGRLNVYLLLPRLLQSNGFRPVIMPSTAHLFSGGFSLDHIATALRWGQDRDLSHGLDDMGQSAPWRLAGDDFGWFPALPDSDASSDSLSDNAAGREPVAGHDFAGVTLSGLPAEDERVAGEPAQTEQPPAGAAGHDQSRGELSSGGEHAIPPAAPAGMPDRTQPSAHQEGAGLPSPDNAPAVQADDIVPASTPVPQPDTADAQRQGSPIQSHIRSGQSEPERGRAQPVPTVPDPSDDASNPPRPAAESPKDEPSKPDAPQPSRAPGTTEHFQGLESSGSSSTEPDLDSPAGEASSPATLPPASNAAEDRHADPIVAPQPSVEPGGLAGERESLGGPESIGAPGDLPRASLSSVPSPDDGAENATSAGLPVAVSSGGDNAPTQAQRTAAQEAPGNAPANDDPVAPRPTDTETGTPLDSLALRPADQAPSIAPGITPGEFAPETGGTPGPPTRHQLTENESLSQPIPLPTREQREMWGQELDRHAAGAGPPPTAIGKQREGAPNSRLSAWERYIEKQNAHQAASTGSPDGEHSLLTAAELDLARRDLTLWGISDPDVILADYRAHPKSGAADPKAMPATDASTNPPKHAAESVADHKAVAQAGAQPNRDPQLPARIGKNLVLSGTDVVESFHSGDEGLKHVESLIRRLGGDETWDTYREQSTALFSDDSLRPKIAGMLRGGRPNILTVKLQDRRTFTIEFAPDGSSEQSQLHFKERVAKYEFEHTADPTNTVGTLDEGRFQTYAVVQGSLTHPNASETATAMASRTHDTALTNQRADRQISGGQTAEPGVRFDGNVEGAIRHWTSDAPQKIDTHNLGYQTEVVVPARDVVDHDVAKQHAEGRDTLHSLPGHSTRNSAPVHGGPPRVRDTHGLSGSDVVTNFWLLPDDPPPSRRDAAEGSSDSRHGQQQSEEKSPAATDDPRPQAFADFLTSEPMLAAFKKAYGSMADRARAETSDWLTVESLQTNLHLMTNKQPMVHHLAGIPGAWIEVHAFIEPLGTPSKTQVVGDRHGGDAASRRDPMMLTTSQTKETEFHFGTETDTTQVRQDAVSWSAQLPMPGRLRGQGGTDTGEAEGGLDGTFTRGEAHTETTSRQFRVRTTLKNPAPGQGWDGQARLRIEMHTAKGVSSPGVDAPFKGAVHETRARFEVLMEQFETEPTTDYLGKEVWAPPARIWGEGPSSERNSVTKSTWWPFGAKQRSKASMAESGTPAPAIPRGRSREETVPLRGLGSMDRVTNLNLSGFHGMLDSMGRRAHGSDWKGLRQNVIGWYHLNRVRASLPGMTQHSPLAHRGTDAFTADIEKLTFRRVINTLSSPSAELTEGSAVTVERNRQTSLQAAAGGRGDHINDSTVLGEAIGGTNRTRRDGERVRNQHRVAVTTKFDQPMAVFDGWVRIDGTIRGSKATVHESGLFPVEVAIPLSELQGSRQHDSHLPPTFTRNQPTGFIEQPPKPSNTTGKAPLPTAPPASQPTKHPGGEAPKGVTAPPPQAASSPPVRLERSRNISYIVDDTIRDDPEAYELIASPTSGVAQTPWRGENAPERQETSDSTTPLVVPNRRTVDEMPVVAETGEGIAGGAADEVDSTDSPEPPEQVRTTLDWTPPPGAEASELPAHALQRGWHPSDVLLGVDPASGLIEAIRNDLGPALGGRTDDAIAGMANEFGPNVIVARLTHQSGQEWTHDIPVPGGKITVVVRPVRGSDAGDTQNVGIAKKFETDVSSESQSATAQINGDQLRRVIGGRVQIPVPHGSVSAQITHTGSVHPKVPSGSRADEGVGHLSAVDVAVVTGETEHRIPTRLRTVEAHDLVRQPIDFDISYTQDVFGKKLSGIPEEPPPVRLSGVFAYAKHTPIADASTTQTLGDGPNAEHPALDINQAVVKIRPHTGAEPATDHVEPNRNSHTPHEDLVAAHVLDEMAPEGIATFGDDWSAVRAELASHIKAIEIQRHLGDYSRRRTETIHLTSVPGGRVVLGGHIDAITTTDNKATTEFYSGGLQSLSAGVSSIETSNWQGYVQFQGDLLPTGDTVNLSALGRLTGGATREGVDVRTENSSTGILFRKKVPTVTHVGTATIEAHMSRPISEGPNNDGLISHVGTAQVEFTTRQPPPDKQKNAWHVPPDGIIPNGHPHTGVAAADDHIEASAPHPESHSAQRDSGLPPRGLSRDSIIRNITDGAEFRSRTLESIGPLNIPHLADQMNSHLTDTRLASKLGAMTRVEAGKDVEFLRQGTLRITGRAEIQSLDFRTIEHEGGNAYLLNDVSRNVFSQRIKAREGGARLLFGPLLKIPNFQASILGGVGGAGRQRHVDILGQGARMTAHAKFPRSYAVFDGEARVTLTVHHAGESHELPAADLHGQILIPESETRPAPPPLQEGADVAGREAKRPVPLDDTVVSASREHPADWAEPLVKTSDPIGTVGHSDAKTVGPREELHRSPRASLSAPSDTHHPAVHPAAHRVSGDPAIPDPGNTGKTGNVDEPDNPPQALLPAQSVVHRSTGSPAGLPIARNPAGPARDRIKDFERHGDQ
ncbi:hypothetical protein ACK280_24655 [Mycobacterium sherrisii]|uniref:WXG100-like domain-containing protein n=1 Tax=Mycobacterium sherrisii TaxID=243061 RepID=UPI0039757622